MNSDHSFPACLRVRFVTVPEHPHDYATAAAVAPSKDPAPEARLYDGNFVLAVVAQTLFTLSNTLMAHYNRWIEFLGGNLEQIGWIMGIGSVVAPLLRPWMGLLMNRIGTRATWSLGLVLFGVGSLGNLWVVELNWTIYLLRTCLVVGAAVVFNSSLTYITLTTPVRRRTEAIGILGAGGFLGMLLGPFLGDLILSGGVRTAGHFGVLFWVTTVALVVPALLVCCLRRPPLTPQKSSLRIGEFVRTVWLYWPGPILLCCLAFGVCMTVPFVFLASYVDKLGLQIPGLSMVGLFFGCYAGWGLTVRVALRRLPDRIGRRKVLLVGLTTMAVGMFCFAPVSAAHPWWLVLPALLCGTGHALIFHTMASLALESFPQEVRGSGSSLSLIMLDVGMIAGAPLLGKIAQSYGFPWMYASIGVVCLSVALVYAYSSLRVWRSRRQIRLIHGERTPWGTVAVAAEVPGAL